VLVADHAADPPRLVDLAEAGEEQLDRIRMHWAVVFQRNALFSGTVYENVALWLREVMHLDEGAIRARAAAAVAAVGLDPETVLAKDREELSGGMAKRVALARALAMEPDLMFFDEPTAGLDPLHAARIAELIDRTHCEGRTRPASRTTLVITHDKDLLFRVRPRVVMLHEGRVLFDGTYAEFLGSDSPVIRPYFALMPALRQSRAPRP
jgi:phospholipid/cholesterol/gamma-HCH transport system ATP-binding protein